MNDQTAPSTAPATATTRRGAVAIIVRDASCLIIRRAEGIAAPGAYCFPGGGIEPGESEADALCRELVEELGVAIVPGRRVWECHTTWGVHLAWWTAELAADAILAPNAAEVAAVFWQPWAAVRSLPGLLESNVALLDAIDRGDVILEGGPVVSSNRGSRR